MKNKIKKLFSIATLAAISSILLSGCATAPPGSFGKTYSTEMSNLWNISVKSEASKGFSCIQILGYNLYYGDSLGRTRMAIKLKNTGPDIRNIKIRVYLWNTDDFPIVMDINSEKYLQDFNYSNIKANSEKRGEVEFYVVRPHPDIPSSWRPLIDIVEIDYFDGTIEKNYKAEENYLKYYKGVKYPFNNQ
ncbi:MAG: hypothetical protein EOM12_14900 [Verrucomicrobiae bacterium]|nr:hypothetical protein [Bacteroidia bacterium]NCC62190.1 hypothetical protein [Verrucomicrobiae bacterium]